MTLAQVFPTEHHIQFASKASLPKNEMQKKSHTWAPSTAYPGSLLCWVHSYLVQFHTLKAGAQALLIDLPPSHQSDQPSTVSEQVLLTARAHKPNAT